MRSGYAYLIASTLRGALAQRLVRKVCNACRQTVQPTREEIAQLQRELGKPGSNAEGSMLLGKPVHASSGAPLRPSLCRGAGCTECKQTGYRGRTGILELLLMDENLRDFVVRRTSATEIRQYMAREKFHSLRQSGWLKVAQGITTPDEVLRATHLGDVADEDAPRA